MARRSPLPSRTWQTIAALVIAAVAAFLKWKSWLPDNSKDHPRPPSASHPPGGNRAPLPAPCRDWQTLTGCTLIEDKGNDGDSFVIAHEGQEWTARLYFVDCPEKHRHQYNGDRIAAQGRYFGNLTEDETVSIGEDARDFTLARLRQPFTVLTRWEPVFDSVRAYVFLQTSEGKDLGEALVSAGLARIYTKGESRPGTTAKAEKSRLQRLEATARKARAGAWGLR